MNDNKIDIVLATILVALIAGCALYGLISLLPTAVVNGLSIILSGTGY